MARTIKAEHRPCTNEEYHDDLTHDSSSVLRIAEDSLAAYYHLRVTGRMKPKPQTPEQRAGTACHAALLEPSRCDELVICIPPGVLSKNGSKSGKPWEEWRDAQRPGAALLKVDEFDALKWQIETVWENPRCRELLLNATRTEYSIFWTDSDGSKLKCRIDLLLELDGVIADVKTSRHDDENFWRSLRDYGGHAQAAHYVDGASHLFGRSFEFKYLLVPSDPPYEDCCVRTLPAAALRLGHERNVEIIRKIRECREGRRPWLRDGVHEDRTLNLPSHFYPEPQL